MANDQKSSSDSNHSTYQLYLHEKLLDLSTSLKVDIQQLVDEKIEKWKQLNVPSDVSLLRPLRSTGGVTNADQNKPYKKQNMIPRHEFVPRASLLNELLTVNHIRGIYNMVLAILCILFISELVDSIVHNGSVNLDLSLITYSFGKFDCVLRIWIPLKLACIFLVYTGFYTWAHYRHLLPLVADITALVNFLCFMTLLLQLPVQALISYQLPPTSSFIILCEQTRLLMKTWAFVRSNVPRARNYQPASDGVRCPSFWCYLYYLFAPTLIYRDQYPRSNLVNWRGVVLDLIQVIGCILFANLLFARFCVPVFQNFGTQPFTKSQLMVWILSCCFPGSLLYLLAFFMFLHCWMNAFAEMMRFSDRMFYKDWWNSTSYARFYRTWNCVVHDWLYEYVYKDVVELHQSIGVSFEMGRRIGMLVVFFISAIVHEFILSFSFRFFYPVLLILFGGFGVLLMFIKIKSEKFNIFLWFSLILGMGILLCLYFLEWYARVNCAPVFDGVMDFVVPRSWFCRL